MRALHRPRSRRPLDPRRFRPRLELLEDRLAPANASPSALITEPLTDGTLVSGFDVHMVLTFADPDPGDTHLATDWEIRTAGTGSATVWQALGATGLDSFHIHLADGSFLGALAGRQELDPDTAYELRARVRDDSGDPLTEWGPWSVRAFTTLPELQPVPGVGSWIAQPGYKVEQVAGGLQLPVNIAFVPDPGDHDHDPVFYVTELYGNIKVVLRDGHVEDYATGLLNFDPTGDFPGSGEKGLAGIVVDPTTGDVLVSVVYDSGGNHYQRVVRFESDDGGATAARSSVVLDLNQETTGPSHQISNLSFGPDGKLYVHVGDGFDLGTPQNLDSYLGKILRVNPDGSAPPDNPFFDAGDGISARDYIFAYGFRNPFGGAWREADGFHYEVENGPSVDRFARVVAGRNYAYDGSNASMTTHALYNWDPAHAPVNLVFLQDGVFGGSRFPADKSGHAFVAESGPTFATGPQSLGKRITEFVLDAAGNLAAGPTDFLVYNGTGRSTVVGLAAGPDGLYFTDLYPEQGFDPTAPGAQVLRVRWIGTAPPTAPTDLAAEGLQPDLALLTWTDTADNEDGFRIESSTNGVDFVQVASVGPNAGTYQVGGLQGGLTYTFRIRAFSNDWGNGVHSATVALTTPGEPQVPPAPTDLAATPGLESVILTWSAVPGAQTYDLYRAETSSGQGSTPYVSGWSGTSFTDTSVVAGTTYYYRLAAINAAGSSPLSPEVSATPEGEPPAPTFEAHINFQPAGAAVPLGYVADTGAVFGARGAGLTYGWNVDVSGGARDRNDPLAPDQRRDTLIHSSGTTWEITVPNGIYAVHLVAGDPSYLDSTYRMLVEGVLAVEGFPSETQRWFEANVTVTVTDGRLTLTDAVGSSNNKVAYVDILSAGAVPVPEAPTGLSATPEPGSIALAWNAVPGAATYAVYRGTTSGGQGPNPIAANLTGTAFTDLAVTPGTTYYYRVAASNSAGPGPLSAEILAAALEPPPPGTFEVHINFQPAGTPVPAGYAADAGDVFGARGNGLDFGWNANNAGGTRDRNAGISDQRFDTLTHAAGLVWEIAVPNGDYTVHLAAGDPSYFDSIHRFEVEGVLLVNGTPSAVNPWIEGMGTVTVADGRLTIRQAAGGVNSKLAFVDIASAGAMSPPPAPTGLVATGLEGQIALAWNPSPGAAAYNLFRGTVSGELDAVPLAAGLTGTSYVDTAVLAGTTYYYQVNAVNIGGAGPLSAEASATVLEPPPPGSFQARINFQPAGAEVPLGYLVDSGALYGSRPNGLSYGWNGPAAGGDRDRNDPASPDQRYDTFLHTTGWVWEIGVPDGLYSVRIVAGDPSYLDSFYKVEVEGVLAIDAAPTPTSRWVEATLIVAVTDGRLTIRDALGAVNNKLAFVDILAADPLEPDPPG